MYINIHLNASFQSARDFCFQGAKNNLTLTFNVENKNKNNNNNNKKKYAHHIICEHKITKWICIYEWETGKT